MLISCRFLGKYTLLLIRNLDQSLICKLRWWSPKCAIKIFDQSSWITQKTNIVSKCKNFKMSKSKTLGSKKIFWSTSWMKVSYSSCWIKTRNWQSHKRRWRVVQEKRLFSRPKAAQQSGKAVNCCAHLTRQMKAFRDKDVEFSDLNLMGKKKRSIWYQNWQNSCFGIWKLHSRKEATMEITALFSSNNRSRTKCTLKLWQKRCLIRPKLNRNLK